MIRLAVIVAAAENGVIGSNNALPWHLPQDLRYFKRVTMGKPIVMGRKTFESIGRPLPGRTNIVITRNPDFRAEGVRVVASLDEALRLAGDIAVIDGVRELVVIGGAEIYRAAIPRADRLYITEVHASVQGDALLPPIDWGRWREVGREHHGASDQNPYEYSFVVYNRAGS
ncbi:MAG: dihydrofolate reductase [Gammaproteobacteria bacterium]|nr:MAG: dihydrofolate reductase [Gammaproteobacteria bacterium]